MKLFVGAKMQYLDGTLLQLGDIVRYRSGESGQVVADITADKYLAPLIAEEWAFLETGVLIKTDFGGIIHYESLFDEDLEFVERNLHVL